MRCSKCVQPAHARGLCKTCYYRQPEWREYQRLYREARRPQLSEYKRANRRKCTDNQLRRKQQSRNASIVGLGPVKEFLRQRPEGLVVDHIVPLMSQHVCGLNVPWNMQWLTPEESTFKNHSFDFTDSNDSWRADYAAVKALRQK
jgi:hypothetical protein